MKLTEIFQVLIITGVMSLVANTVGTKNDLMQAIPGMGILIAIAFIGMWMGRVLPGKIPGVAYVVCLLYTSPSPRDGLLSRMPSSA